MNPFQGTVACPIEIVGVGLHSGNLIQIEIFPANPNFGIKFVRSDLSDATPVLAHPSNIVSTMLCTTIGNDKKATIATIEHLMAAFAGLGIDNVLVKVNAPEIPILDGSAAPFVDRLLEAGVQRQPERRQLLELDRSFEIREGRHFMRYDPHSHRNGGCDLHLDYAINFSNSNIIGCQKLAVDFDQEGFMSLCEARTFCHIDDVNLMRSKGLALGGSLDNAVVVNHYEVINNDGLRFPDEFVRHKILDCIGDLALLGGRLRGMITANMAGHALHAKFMLRFLEEKTYLKQTSSAQIASG